MQADRPNDDGTDKHPMADSDAALPTHLDFDLDGGIESHEELTALVGRLTERDVDPLVATLLESLVELTGRLQARIEDLEADQEQTHDIATTAVGKAATNETEISELDDREDKTRDIAKSAIAKTQQLEADPDQQEDAERLPEGIEPSSSPLDFFANVRQSTVKELFVEQSNKSNTYRAIQVAKRWPEFATKRHDGSGVFLSKDDVTTALTAELGSKPHRQTVHRVWDKLCKLGGQDLQVKTRQVGTSDSKTEILTMGIETAQRLNEQRYVGLDLLSDGIADGTASGVTPVVTGTPTHAL
jgi:hypothetical protein